MDNNHLSRSQHVFNPAFFLKNLARLDVRVHCLVVGIQVNSPDELVECLKVQTEVKVMYECLLFVSDVNEGSIQGRENLLDFSKIDISYRITVPLAGLFVEFDEPMVFHQCYRNFS